MKASLRKYALPRADLLLAISQMHRAIAARRMRLKFPGLDVIGGRRGGRRQLRHCLLEAAILRRLILGRDVVQDRREPAFGLLDAKALARGVILDLIALDLADAEIEAFGMTEIKPGHGRAWPHRKAFGERHAGGVLGIEQPEQRRLLGVIGLRRIAGRGADALILLEDKIIGREVFIRCITPEFAAYPRMHALGKG